MIALLLLMNSCADFLDVNPKGEVFDKDMFESAEGYEDALYGIYAELATEQYLYSDYMIWLPEVLSLNISTSDNALQYMAYGQWTNAGASPIRNSIWAKLYKVINHINNILSHIEEGGDEQFEYSKLYKGEALALRAMIHFDLLRLYGAPVWAEDKSRAIPYVTKYSFDITPFSSVDQVYDYIISDLKEAEECLEADQSLVMSVRNNQTAGFTSCRVLHMNLYAVQALIARVYWSKNDLESAAEYATKVVESEKFSFRSTEAFNQPDNGTVDMNETIFALYSKSFQEKNASRYGLSGTSSSSTFVLANDYKSIYEEGSSVDVTDYRLSAWFDVGQNQLTKLVNRIYYQTAGNYTGKSILGINMIRLPEMYYILAEYYMESNPAKATEYFDAVITTRGLASLSENSATVTAEDLYIERRKEFYGEGFHWYDMKRLGKDINVSVETILPGDDINTYKIPYPKTEDESRNN